MINGSDLTPRQKAWLAQNVPRDGQEKVMADELPPSLEGHHEAIKEGIKEEEKYQKKFDDMVKKSTEVLLKKRPFSLLIFSQIPSQLT